MNTRPSLWRGVVMSGRPVAGNLGGVATWVSRGGKIWEKERANRRAPSISDSGMVMGWQASSCAEMGQGQRRAGLAARKMAHDGFFPF
jgi:hypothetical protein